MSVNQAFAASYIVIFLVTFSLIIVILSRYVIRIDGSHRIAINSRRLKKLLGVYLLVLGLVCGFYPLSAIVREWDSLSVTIESVNRNRLALHYRLQMTEKLFPEMMVTNAWCSAAVYAEHTQAMLYRKYTCPISAESCANNAIEVYDVLQREHQTKRPSEANWITDFTIAQDALDYMAYVNSDGIKVLSAVMRHEGLITTPELLNDEKSYPNIIDTAYFLNTWQKLLPVCVSRPVKGWGAHLNKPLITQIYQQTSLR